MTLINYYDVPQNTFVTVALYRPAVGVRIENNSNQFITVRDDLGHDVAACPPGISASWNRLEGLHTPQIGCLGYYQGSARVYFYDTQVDTSSNPPLQQPPGTIPVSGAVGVSGIVPVSGTVDVSSIGGTTNVSGNVNDLTTQANTNQLLGVIPQSRIAITVNPTTPTAVVNLTRGVTRALVRIVTIRANGLYSITVAQGGVTDTLLDSRWTTADIGYDVPRLIPLVAAPGAIFSVISVGLDADFVVTV